MFVIYKERETTTTIPRPPPPRCTRARAAATSRRSPYLAQTRRAALAAPALPTAALHRARHTHLPCQHKASSQMQPRNARWCGTAPLWHKPLVKGRQTASAAAAAQPPECSPSKLNRGGCAARPGMRCVQPPCGQPPCGTCSLESNPICTRYGARCGAALLSLQSGAAVVVPTLVTGPLGMAVAPKVPGQRQPPLSPDSWGAERPYSSFSLPRQACSLCGYK